MTRVIYGGREENKTERLPPNLMALFPEVLCRAIREAPLAGSCIEEVRLRRDKAVMLTLPEKTLVLDMICSGVMMDELLRRICDGSLYAHRDGICEGFVTLSGGIRVGVCGRAAVEHGQVIGVYEVSSMNFRIPTSVGRVGAPIVRLLRGAGNGVLIYAPPSGGKTTLLRSVTAQLASGDGAYRVAVVDTRGELGCGLTDPRLSVDLLYGYPKALGIEIAARTLNPQIIVCDEIGGPQEAEAIAAAQNNGIGFLATAHGGSLAELMRRSSVAHLHRCRVFSHYAGIRRRHGGGEFLYSINSWEEADAVQNSGCVDPGGQRTVGGVFHESGGKCGSGTG